MTETNELNTCKDIHITILTMYARGYSLTKMYFCNFHSVTVHIARSLDEVSFSIRGKNSFSIYSLLLYVGTAWAGIL